MSDRYKMSWDDKAADKATAHIHANPTDEKREAARVAHCNGQQLGRLEGKRDAERALLPLLERLEYPAGDCAICGGHNPECCDTGGHYPNCELAAAIKRIRGE